MKSPERGEPAEFKSTLLCGIGIYFTPTGFEIEVSKIPVEPFAAVLAKDTKLKEEVAHEIVIAYKYCLENILETQRILERRFNAEGVDDEKETAVQDDPLTV